METDEMSEDWQSNLTNWKSLRKSQSSYQRVQDLDPPEEAPQKPRAKTYREMMEERQRRKSSRAQHSVDDLDDDDMDFGSSKSRGASFDDANQDMVFSQSSVNQSSFKDEEHVGQTLRYDAEKSEGIKKENKFSTAADPPPTSNNHVQKSNDIMTTNQQKTKTDSNYDFSSPLKDSKKPSNFSSHRDKFETGVTTTPSTSSGKSLGDIKARASGGGNISDKLKMFNKPTEPTETIHNSHKSSVDQKRNSGVTGKENVVKKNSENMFFEKVIRINQRPNHEKGFGFTISGGREHNAPIVVDKVVRGGSADICELKAGDEIIAINGADVARHYNESVQNVLAQSVATGTIELRVKRLRDLEEEFEEEVFSDDEDSKPVDTPRKAHNISGSQSSLWSSPPSSPPAPPSVIDTSDYLNDDLPPPPLPSVPPPPPNWNTFPGEIRPPSSGVTSEATPAVSLDRPPAFGATTNLEKISGYDHRAVEPRDLPDKSREDILRKKSEFLGLRPGESEELRALKGDQEKKLKAELTTSISVSDSWNSSVHPLPPTANDLLTNKKPLFGSVMENNSANASSSGGFTMPGGGGGSVHTEWSSSKRLEMDNKPDLAAVEEARKREQREQQKLKEKEEQLKQMEEKIRHEAEQLEREKRRIAQETEQQLSLEREKLRQETERQLQKERERLLKEKEEQLRQGQERLQREKEENLRRQNEEQLKREKQRMERDMEEQIRLERERLTREKDEAIKRERDRLQREQEVQKERLQREKEETLRQQNEEQLRRERQRLEKESEEQLRLERERLTREKDEMLKRERERLQREQEQQKKELQEQFRLEQERLERAEQERMLNSKASDVSLSRGISHGGYGTQPDARKLSSAEPSDSDVAEYSMKYGGKTFARLAAHTRSDSLGAAGSKPPGNEAPFPRPAGFSQEMQRPVSKKLDKADINENFSSIRSNFANSRTPSVPSKALEPAPWKQPGSQQHHDINKQSLSDRYNEDQRQTGSAEFPQPPSMAPWHGRTASLGAQVGTERTATVEPQMRGQTDPDFESQFRGSASLQPQFGLQPSVGERTTSLGPNVGERTSSFGQPSGGKREQQEALPPTRNQNVSSVVYPRAEEHRAPPLVGERTASLGPQSKEHNTRLGPQFGEPRTLFEDERVRKPSSGDQSTMTPLSNISYLLYGDEQRTDRQSTAPENFRPEETRPGGYNSYVQGYNKPSGAAAAVPPPVDNGRMSTASNVQRDKGFPSYYPPSSANQFNESGLSHNANTLPNPKRNDGTQAKHATSGGPKPFEAPWKYQSNTNDHWLVEEAERMRIAEQTGQERSWNLGREHPHDFQKTLPLEHGPGAWTPVNPYATRPSAVETLRSPRSVPEPVKQTLLNRINTGASPKSPTLLGPLPSYPKDFSQGPPSHSRSVSNPVTDSHLYGNVGQFPPPPLGSTAPLSHTSSGGGGAVDSLFAYHQQTAQPETNLMSQASLSHSQGSLHLDGTPQYSSTLQSYKIQGSYPGPANAPHSGTMPNVQAQGGQSYRVYTTQEPVGRDMGSFPSYCQPVVNNLLCTNCQRPLNEINGRVFMRDGDLKLHCQNCLQENEVKYSKV